VLETYARHKSKKKPVKENEPMQESEGMREKKAINHSTFIFSFGSRKAQGKKSLATGLDKLMSDIAPWSSTAVSE